MSNPASELYKTLFGDPQELTPDQRAIIDAIPVIVPKGIHSYSKDSDSDSKKSNGLQSEDCNPLISLTNLAEWTGLEPATPGVTGRCAK